MASTHKSLRSGTANKRPTTSIADGQIALNTNAASPGLYFKDSTGASIIKIGPVHVGTTAPNVAPAGSSGNSNGETWLDTSLTPNGWKVWTGAAWTNATPVGSSTVQGLLELATDAETQAGSDTARAVTPAGLQSKVSDSTSTSSSTTIASSTAVKSAYDLANAALPKSGGTVTGNLEIGTSGSLTFEGATADAFETTIAVVDPTADRTITFPDTTGTVVTTGDTGTVTSAMIANSTIVDADISASAEIAVSKLADGAARQLLQTDAAGTGVEWTTNVDVPGTLDVTGTTTLDSTLSVPLGSAAAPTVFFTGDSNTGIYSPGADQVAISTNGTGRLFIASDGKIGCGIASPSYGLQLINSASSFALGETGSNVRLVLNYGSPTSSTAAPTITSDGEGLYYFGRNGYAGQHIFYSGPSNSERMRLTSAGLLGLGTSSPQAELHVVKASGESSLYLDRTGGALLYLQGTASEGVIGTGTNHPLYIRQNGGNAITIDTSKRVGIGTTAPQELLHVNNSAATSRLIVGPAGIGAATPNALALEQENTGYTVCHVRNLYNNSGLGELRLGGYGFTTFTSGSSQTERARIDSSGRLLVGTSTARDKVYNGTTVGNIPQFQSEVSGDGVISRAMITGNCGTGVSDIGPALILARSTGTTVNSYTAVTSVANHLGSVSFQGADGTEFVEGARIEAFVDGTPGANDMPGRLVFSTTADGAASPTERMRISNDGTVYVGTTSKTGEGIALEDTSNGGRLYIGRNNNDSVAEFQYSGTRVGQINVTSTSTSYITSSDYRLKENVVPLTGAINRLQQIPVHRFNFIVDPDKTVDGFIAHEAQAVVPECVTGEKDAVDDNGNPVYQGIDQSKLVPLLTAALQEAVAEIKALKDRVTALEGA
jgi:hypothetical protein